MVLREAYIRGGMEFIVILSVVVILTLLLPPLFEEGELFSSQAVTGAVEDHPPGAIEEPRVGPTYLYHIHGEVSPHAMSFKGTPQHIDNGYCIHPPPFGAQCTVRSEDALAACAKADGCTSWVCPDQGLYLPDGGSAKSKGVTGPICQLRSSATSLEMDEINHGMCKPSGCASFLVSLKTTEELEAAGIIFVDETFQDRVRDKDYVFEEKIEGSFMFMEDHYQGYSTVHTQTHQETTLIVLRESL
mmetsp:Transcript_3306/g.6730  ORF Transcript_3306/g.6730 Transcript_3306/m.6730 type:complete len:245 (+) Transcript_3306:54-788(+)